MHNGMSARQRGGQALVGVVSYKTKRRPTGCFSVATPTESDLRLALASGTFVCSSHTCTTADPRAPLFCVTCLVICAVRHSTDPTQSTS